MEGMAQLTSAPQADLAQVILLLCQSGEAIITLLRAVMRQVFHQIQLRQALLLLILVIQTVQLCTLNIVQTAGLPGALIPVDVAPPQLYLALLQVQRTKLE
jgi:hypothetical protein